MPTVTKLDKPVLTSGSQGVAVRELQNLLNGYASYLRNPQFIVNVVDGEFGPMTRRAVLAFQRQVFLPETGVVADLTWRSLYNRGPVELPQLVVIQICCYLLRESYLVCLSTKETTRLQHNLQNRSI
jgi:peptidoglycan hydrolase-like protein with peptidoglycan-binding domain